MAIQPDLVGTVTLEEASAAFDWTGISLTVADIRPGDTIFLPEKGLSFVIGEVTGAGSGMLTDPVPAVADGEDQAARIRFQSDLSRMPAATRDLLLKLSSGNITSLAGLEGYAGAIMTFLGPGVLGAINRADLIQGVHYDVQVDDLSGRDFYDSEDAGFSLLVSDTGDGRAAIFVKASASSGDWSDPAFITGPLANIEVEPVVVGDYGSEPDVSASPLPGGSSLTFTLPAGPEFVAGTIDTVAPGAPATLTPVPVEGGYRLDGEIPAGAGFYWRGAYGGATAYQKDDVIADQNSSWIALQATTGNAPPTLPTSSNEYWQLLARTGLDGTGLVNEIGSGAGISVDDADPTAPIVSLSDMEQATLKGRAAGAGTGAPQDLTPAQAREAMGATTVGSALLTASDKPAAQAALDQGSVLLQSGTISSPVSSLDLSLPSDYDSFGLTLTMVEPASDSAQLLVRFAQGGSFINASGSYGFTSFYATLSSSGVWSSTSSSTTTAIIISGGTMGASAGNFSAFDVLINRAASGNRAGIIWRGGGGTGASAISVTGSGNLVSGGAATDIRLLFNTGNIQKGRYQLYGMRK